MKTKSMAQSKKNTDTFTHADPDMYALGTKHANTKSQTRPAGAVCLLCSYFPPDLFKTPAEEEMRTMGACTGLPGEKHT